MKIVCSAGKGEMDHTACLNCALVNQLSPCGFDYSVLKSLYSDSEQEKRRNEVHVTDITGCLRKAWYDKVDPTPEAPHKMLARWMGTAIHATLEGSDEHLESEMVLSAGGLTGKSDIVYKDGRVVDFKTTRWLYVDKVPYGSHALQVNIYAYMLRQMGHDVNRLQIQYIDVSGPTKCRSCKTTVIMVDGECKCPSCQKIMSNAHLGAVLVDVLMQSDAEMKAVVGTRVADLRAALEMKLAPQKEPGFLCDYCGSRGKCVPELMD